MSIPDFQRFMLPFLIVLKDGKEHSLTEIKGIIATEFNLSDEELNETIPSGKQTKFDNRVGWARTHLKKALLLDITSRGIFRITPRGHEALKTNPSEINKKFLERYPEYQKFRSILKPEGKGEEKEEDLLQTPEERLGSIYQEIQHNLAHELLENIKSAPPSFLKPW